MQTVENDYLIDYNTEIDQKQNTQQKNSPDPTNQMR